mmetsp:Transcript_5460/g.17668  ORF Transcript_5460/g.17668 Transcript_5460/m.17668 type:complete len:212 (-) Transcript_5460:1040-1675(-)
MAQRGQRSDHEHGQPASRLVPHCLQEGCRLHGLAEAHLIRKNAPPSLKVAEDEPVDTVKLVVTELVAVAKVWRLFHLPVRLAHFLGCRVSVPLAKACYNLLINPVDRLPRRFGMRQPFPLHQGQVHAQPRLGNDPTRGRFAEGAVGTSIAHKAVGKGKVSRGEVDTGMVEGTPAATRTVDHRTAHQVATHAAGVEACRVHRQRGRRGRRRS